MTDLMKSIEAEIIAIKQASTIGSDAWLAACESGEALDARNTGLAIHYLHRARRAYWMDNDGTLDQVMKAAPVPIPEEE